MRRLSRTWSQATSTGFIKIDRIIENQSWTSVANSCASAPLRFEVYAINKEGESPPVQVSSAPVAKQRLFPSFYLKQSFGSPCHPRILSAAENLNFSLSQWRRRPRTSRQASRGSRVGVQFSPIDSNSRSRYRRLWQQVGDAEVEQTNGHWRPSHHTFYHSGWSTQATHRQIQQISVAVWNNSQPNFFCRKRTSSEVGSTR